uniref:Putative low density lipoprotein receptor adaptor protein 1 n=1 Tax=Corethrella appendiculata TaxID=1370023 RepID=U5ER70_9DIPT
MSFFRSMWKNSSKHKKLCEELALAHSIRDYSENHDELDDGSDDAISFGVKYLGNVNVKTARSEDATSAAVKNIISNAKKIGNKKLQRVSLSISPKGIEMFDQVTGENLLQVSIYKISYCSADANHSHVFAFVGSSKSAPEIQEESFSQTTPLNIKKDDDDEDENNEDDIDSNESLVCYAFLCQKRKMAQTVTLTVARSFERAYQIWQNKQFFIEQRHKEIEKKCNKSNLENNKQCNNSNSNQTSNENERENNSVRSLLIDFNSELTAELCAKDHREYFQNTWVSFEDDQPQEFSPAIQQTAWSANTPTICSS